MRPAELRAIMVIEEGEPFEEGWHEEGDAESGPMGGTIFGYRAGDTVVELTSNGSVHVYDVTGDRPGEVVYSSSPVGTASYAGIGAMIKDHLHAIERNAGRNGLEFVKTGRRPDEGYYSLKEIVARERRRRND